MRKQFFFGYYLFILNAVLFSLVSVMSSWAKVPLPGFIDLPISDQAHLFSAQEKAWLTKEIFRLRDEKKIYLAVVTIESLEEESIEEFSIRFAEKAKVGELNKDNGLIFVLALKERAMRIEVGRGLEGEITDYQSHMWIKNLLIPAMREGGATLAVSSLISVLNPNQMSKDAKGWDKKRKTLSLKKAQALGLNISPLLLISLALITFILVPITMVLIKSQFMRGIISGSLFVSAGILSSGISQLLVFLFFLGLVIGFIGPFQLIYLILTHSSHGGRSDNGFGGGSGGGFGSSGGFGGGGGSFGGGGASGRW